MRKKISKVCKSCGLTYFGVPKSKYCSCKCFGKDAHIGKVGQHLSPNSEFKKGMTPWNKNKKGIVSQETRDKMSKSAKKRPPMTEETRRKFSEARKRLPNYMEGKKHTEETKKKMSESHRGDKSSFWRGGITKLAAKIRGCFKYRQWRSDVYQRDDYTCCICGVKGGKLHADHIKTFSLILRENNIITLKQAIECEKLWNINNGQTLCVPCHKKTDTYLSGAIKSNNQKLILSPIQTQPVT